MPIANCIITSECYKKSDNSLNLIELWAEESGIPSEHMTVNMTISNKQLGKHYNVMSNLLLPSLWSKSEVSSIQLGLSRALTAYFDIGPETIHIITNIVGSGMVVEEGKEIEW